MKVKQIYFANVLNLVHKKLFRKSPKMKFNFDFLYRKKFFDPHVLEDTQLSRVLGVWDITALGTKFFCLFYKVI